MPPTSSFPSYYGAMPGQPDFYGMNMNLPNLSDLDRKKMSPPTSLSSLPYPGAQPGNHPILLFNSRRLKKSLAFFRL